MHRLKLYIILFFLLPLFGVVRATKIETLNFGYGANQYTSILQDEKGLMWLGCNRGLFFYDGYQAHPFLLDTYIYSIVQVDDDLLCFTDEHGAYFLQLSTEQLLPTALSTVDLGQVRASYSKDGVVWLGSEKLGLIAYNASKDTWKTIHENSGEIYSIEQGDGKIYIGGERGLGYYDLTDEAYYTIDLPSYKTSELVNSLLWDEQRDCLWLGTIGALYSYSPSSNEFRKIDVKPTSFKCMTFNVDGLLMVGTDNGLLEYNPERNSVSYREHDVRYQHSLSSNIIWGIYKDRAHNIWLGTDQSVSLLHYSPYYHYVPILSLTDQSSLPTSEGNHFTCIKKDSKGTYWFGGTNGLIRQSADELLWFRTGNKQHPLPHNRIRRIYEDKEGQVWLATDEGVLRYNEHTRQFVPYHIVDASGNANATWAYDIVEDNKGRLWVATYAGGLFVMDKQALINNRQDEFVSPTIKEVATGANHLPSHVFYIIEDKKGNLWLGHRHGLSYVDIETLQVEEIPILNEHGELGRSYINNLTMGEDGNLWYTIKDHLIKVNMTTREVTSLAVSCMGDDVVRTMTYRDGSLWMVMADKTILFDTRTMACKELLLPNNNYQISYYDKENSELIFGGNDGLLYVQPEISTISEKPYGAQVVSVLSNNERLKPHIDYLRKDYGGKLYDSFAPSILQLTLEISDFSYSEANTLSYQYQLEGYDDKWISLSPGNNRIVFLNLSPGRYELKMRNGIDSTVVSSYYFEIRPPWYMTSWAYALYVLITLLALALLIRLLFNKNKKKYERLEREKSLELSNMKIDFFTNISHELKTPLSLIIAPLSKIAGEVESSAVSQQLQMVHQNALRLNTLIQQILDFKRMEYKEEETLVRSRTDLVRLLHMVVGSFNQVVENRHISIRLDSPLDALWVNVDVFKMESIFYNLLSNAIKFVPNNTGSIVVKLNCDEAAQQILIQVEDNGIGIAPEELKLIWLRLYQGGNKQLNPQGTGIGLYLVKRFITLHEGEVSIESQPQQGTVVKIQLPYSGSNLVPAIADVESGVAEILPTKPADLRPTLLIIDDNEELLNFLVSAFSSTYQCLQAKDGKEGLDMALQLRPQIIIVDEMMPVMSGMEFCQRLRKSTHMASTPIVMLTAKDDTATELNSMKAGVDIFMSKPFDLSRLTLRIEQLLESRKQLQEKIHVDQMIETTVDVKEELFNDDERLMKRILQVIEDRMSDSSFNVTQLCTETGIGSKRLLRMLKKQTGMTPVNFIRQIRLKKAAILLQQNKFTVSEVMYMIGFSHPSYFTKSFTEEFGISPKEYVEREANNTL